MSKLQNREKKNNGRRINRTPKYSEMSPHTRKNDHHQKKSTNKKGWRGCGEKGTLLHCRWEYKLVQALWRTVWKSLKN